MTKNSKNMRVYILLAAILIIGIFLRIYAFAQLTTPDKFTFSTDPVHYYQLAANIYDGKGPSVNYILQFWYRVPFGYPDVIWEPLFSYILAAFFVLFGKSIIAGTLTVLIFSMASVVAVYFTGKTVYNEKIGLIAAFLLAIQPKHIIYSIAIMKDNVFIFFVVFSFLFMFLSFRDKRMLYWILSGVFLGMTFLTRYMGAVFILSFLILIFLRRDKINFKHAAASVVCLILVILPWGLYTYGIFGQPFFSVTKYYSYSDSGWVGMSYEEKAPDLGNYLRNNSMADIILVRLGMIPALIYSLPIWFTPLIFIFLVYLFFTRSDDYIFNIKVYFCSLMVLYFLQFSSMNMLNERVFLAFVYISLVPISYSILKISPPISKMMKGKFDAKYIAAAIIFLIAISSVFLMQWNISKINEYDTLAKKQGALAELGIWMEKNTPKGSTIMTVFPMDVHYYTGKKTVMDPYNSAINIDKNNKFRYENRSREEIYNYNVTHVLIHVKNEDSLFGFKGLDLKLIYEDSINELYLYEIVRSG